MRKFFYLILVQRAHYLRLLVGVVVMLAVIRAPLLFGQTFGQATGPTLTIPQAIPAAVGRPVTVPIQLHTDGAAVASVAFSIDFDQSCLRFDANDNNGDGQLDSVHFNAPPMFRGSVAYAADDLDGELDFVIADFSPPIATLPDTAALVTIEFTPICSPTATTPVTAAVAFSHAPAVSFGDPGGNDLTSSSNDGSVLVRDPQLAVTKSANVAEAIVGETAIRYSYRMTNTGDIALSVQAVDDKLGNIVLAVLPGGTALLPDALLQPGQVAVGTRTYTPQMSDLPGPLVNNVLITGTLAAGSALTATTKAAVDLLVRGQAQTICVGEALQANINPPPTWAGNSTPFQLIVIQGPAPQGLLLRGVTQCLPYTGLSSLVEQTNQLVTQGCANNSACNAVTRLVFDYDGSYRIETIHEVQTVTTLFLPLVSNSCIGGLSCQ